MLTRLFLKIWLQVPVGYICRIHHNDASMTLRKDYWISVSRGDKTDLLPITAVSHHLQNEFALRMKALGYDVDAYFDENVHAPVASIREINIRNSTTPGSHVVDELSVASAEEKN